MFIGRELFSNFAYLFFGRRPVRFACIAVQRQLPCFQRGFKRIAAERDRQIVIVGTNSVELGVIIHIKPRPSARLFPRKPDCEPVNKRYDDAPAPVIRGQEQPGPEDRKTQVHSDSRLLGNRR